MSEWQGHLLSCSGQLKKYWYQNNGSWGSCCCCNFLQSPPSSWEPPEHSLSSFNKKIMILKFADWHEFFHGFNKMGRWKKERLEIICHYFLCKFVWNHKSKLEKHRNWFQKLLQTAIFTFDAIWCQCNQCGNFFHSKYSVILLRLCFSSDWLRNVDEGFKFGQLRWHW